MTKKIKIVIADDHLLIAETWATLINMDPDFEVVKVFDNTQTLVEEISDIKPDIAILDININPFSGIEAMVPWVMLPKVLIKMKCTKQFEV